MSPSFHQSLLREHIAQPVGDAGGGGWVIVRHHRDRVAEVEIYVQLAVDAWKAAFMPDDTMTVTAVVPEPIGVSDEEVFRVPEKCWKH